MEARSQSLLLGATRLIGDLSYQKRPRGQFTKQGLLTHIMFILGEKSTILC